MRRCAYCKEHLPLDRFSPGTGRSARWERDGYRINCKDCTRKLRRDWKSRNPDKVKAAARRYREKNRDYIALYKRYRKAIGTGRLSYQQMEEARDWMRVIRQDPCSYCGETGSTVDHIIPLAEGGQDRPENLVGACASCNSEKGARSLLTLYVRRVRA